MLRNTSERGPVPEGPYDLVVVGGGINGCAIAREAVLRGHSVALFEKGDFGWATSSNTSKLAHGGIRYLEQFDLPLVFEALRERAILCRMAPHLVRPQSFLIPVYESSRRGPRRVRLGLFLYDVLALGRRLGPSRYLKREDVLERAPDLRPEGLLGGGLYYDAVMDDARIALLNAVAAREEAQVRGVPCVLRNYAEVLSHRPTSPIRVIVRDRVTGRTQEVFSRRLVRALGPWTEKEHLVPSKGIHVVLPPFPVGDALLFEHSRDGRVFFLVPWKGLSVAGTTETPYSGPPDRLEVEPHEVDYLLEELHRYFPRLRFGREDILGTFAGVRPLAKRRALFRRSGDPGAVSRRHRIVDDGHGTLTVFGGKFTTYRAVARETANRALGGPAPPTHRLPLPGGEGGTWDKFQSAVSREEVERHGLARIERLFRRYGTRYREVLALGERDPDLLEPLAVDVAELRAEVVYGVEREFVVYPEDFLARRTSLRFRRDGALSVYDEVEALIRKYARTLPPDLEPAREAYREARAREAALRGTPHPAGS